MVFGWLKRKAQIATIDAMDTDLERFLLGLKGADNSALGMVIALGAYWRDNLMRNFGWDVTDPVTLEREHLSAALTMNRLIRQTQKDTPTIVPGLMLWLHSIRAANTPELRLKGREMWRELQRGKEDARTAAYELIAMGVPIPDFHFEDMVPFGLEPFPRTEI